MNNIPFNWFPGPLPDGSVYIPPPHCCNDVRHMDDVREVANFRECSCEIDWYDSNLHPWIISQFSTDKEPAFDFRSSKDLRLCKDIRHPYAITIKQLIYSMGRRMRTWDDFRLWYQEVLDMDTAHGVSLDKIGKLLGIDRKVRIRDTGEDQFGFSGQFPRTGFNQQPFTVKPRPRNGFFEQDLPDHLFRRLLWFKSFANRCDDSTATLNWLLRVALGNPVSKPLVVNDLQSMHLRVTYLWPASPLDQAIVEKAFALVKPMGMSYSSYVAARDVETFGFNGQELQNFGHGNFSPHRVINLGGSNTPTDDGLMFGFRGSNRTGFDTYPSHGFAGSMNTAGRRSATYLPVEPKETE